MKTQISATILGGLLTLGTIAAFRFGGIMIAVAVIFAFLLGAFLMTWFLIRPLVRHPYIHMYWDGKHLVRDSMLRPLTGTRDMNGKLIEPGNLVMMLESGHLLLISKNPIPKEISDQLNNSES
jgi:hypothetical protein